MRSSPPAYGTGPRLDNVDVRRLAATFASTVCRGDVPEPSPGERSWVCLEQSNTHDAWLILWPVGLGLEMHDHGNSPAAVAVVNGALRERYVSGVSITERTLVAGDLVELGADHVHEVFNVSDSFALSVHVYSPPLSSVGFRPEFL